MQLLKRHVQVSKEKALIELKKQMAKPKLDTIVVKDVSLNDYFGAYEDLDKVIINFGNEEYHEKIKPLIEKVK